MSSRHCIRSRTHSSLCAETLIGVKVSTLQSSSYVVYGRWLTRTAWDHHRQRPPSLRPDRYKSGASSADLTVHLPAGGMVQARATPPSRVPALRTALLSPGATHGATRPVEPHQRAQEGKGDAVGEATRLADCRLTSSHARAATALPNSLETGADAGPGLLCARVHGVAVGPVADVLHALAPVQNAF